MTLIRCVRSLRAPLVVGLLCGASLAFGKGDNTGKNDAKRSEQGEAPTADQAKNDKSDVEVAAKIRRSVMADKDLSTSAHNVKIIAENGTVTLKGPVKSPSEKSTIARKAAEVVGVKNVRNEIEIAP